MRIGLRKFPRERSWKKCVECERKERKTKPRRMPAWESATSQTALKQTDATQSHQKLLRRKWFCDGFAISPSGGWLVYRCPLQQSILLRSQWACGGRCHHLGLDTLMLPWRLHAVSYLLIPFFCFVVAALARYSTLILLHWDLCVAINVVSE